MEHVVHQKIAEINAKMRRGATWIRNYAANQDVRDVPDSLKILNIIAGNQEIYMDRITKILAAEDAARKILEEKIANTPQIDPSLVITPEELTAINAMAARLNLDPKTGEPIVTHA